MVNTATIAWPVEMLSGLKEQPKLKDFIGRSMRIYIAGPYSKGDTALNVRNAILAGDKLLEMGHIPFVPHLTHFWHYISPKPWDVWLKIDQDWLIVCDAILRLPGESKGADQEMEIAMDLHMIVFYDLSEVPDLRSK